MTALRIDTECWLILFYCYTAYCHLKLLCQTVQLEISNEYYVLDYFYILESISPVSTTSMQFFTCKMYPKCIRQEHEASTV